MEDVRVRIYQHAGALDRQLQWPVKVRAIGTFDGKRVGWTRERASSEGRTTRARTGLLKSRAEALAEDVKAGKRRPLPVVAYYGTQRLWQQKKVTMAKRRVGSRYDGYVDALDPASNHRLLAGWMYRQTLVELQSGKKVPQLRAVERAVCDCIDGATRFFFDVKHQELRLDRKGGERLPFSALSDGYRNMVAMVADIAWRAAVLNPHFASAAAERAEGVVLIDEIDLHLHPRWQRRVLGDLRRTFPGLQFVATTHSPQVLSSARREELRIFQENKLVEAVPFIEGRDSNGLLEDVLGVPERPEEMQAKIDEVARLLDEERYAPAAKALAALEAKLGPDDPAVIRARWILDREAVPETGG
jgi:predicted ATP-binding protein involved in virulence